MLINNPFYKKIEIPKKCLYFFDNLFSKNKLFFREKLLSLAAEKGHTMWKNCNWWQKILYVVNVALGGLLLLALILPYIPPRTFKFSVLSLFVPLLLIINILFIFIWFRFRKKILFFSFFLFLFSIPFFGRFFQIFGKNFAEESDISLMSFNVRIFNHFNWNSDKNLNSKIVSFIKEQHPKIIAIQEFHRNETHSFPFYPHRKIIYKQPSHNIGMAILSDYPIINSGSLNFPNTSNNGIFADIVVEKDTLRVYSLHLESFRLNPEEKEFFSQENSEKILQKLEHRFAIQQTQLEIFNTHRKNSPYPIVVCGDFNNTAFSYLYRQIKSNRLQDSFQQCGSGFGQTYDYKYFPFRIDYILVDKLFEVSSYKTFSEEIYSDHYPILTTFRYKK